MKTKPKTYFLAAIVSITVLGCASTPRYTSRQPFGRGSRSEVLEETVEPYIGIPYRYGGESRRGMDCSGFVRTIYREAYGIKLPRNSADMFRLGRGVGKRSLRPGDLVFFGTSGKGITHVGIYMGGGKFAHVSESKGVAVTRLGSSYYKWRYMGARRILE